MTNYVIPTVSSELVSEQSYLTLDKMESIRRTVIALTVKGFLIGEISDNARAELNLEGS